MLICVNIKNDVGHPKQYFITADLRWVWKKRAFVSQILIKHQQFYAWVHSWRTDYSTGEKGSGRRNMDHTDLTDTSCLCKFLKPHMKIPVCAVPSSDRQVFVRFRSHCTGLLTEKAVICVNSIWETIEKPVNSDIESCCHTKSVWR